MKPIGIGQLKKAQRRGTRHQFEPTKTPKATKVTKKTKSKTKSSAAKQEGQLSVDVYQTEEDIVIIAPVAGTAPEDVSISITDDVITIKGQRQIPSTDAIQTEDFYIQECFWGTFSRSIVLPAAVDTRHVDAVCLNNILTIRIPKLERVRTRVVKITEK
jgi:HSP20 family protein